MVMSTPYSLGIAAQGFDGMVIGITASLPFVGKLVSWFEGTMGSVEEAAKPDDDGTGTSAVGIELGQMKSIEQEVRPISEVSDFQASLTSLRFVSR